MSKPVKRKAKVKVYRPEHVPQELGDVWHGAAVRLARKNSLLTSDGNVNYPLLNETYEKTLAAYRVAAIKASRRAALSDRRKKALQGSLRKFQELEIRFRMFAEGIKEEDQGEVPTDKLIQGLDLVKAGLEEMDKVLNSPSAMTMPVYEG